MARNWRDGVDLDNEPIARTSASQASGFEMSTLVLSFSLMPRSRYAGDPSWRLEKPGYPSGSDYDGGL
jgi:hypothetical protein